MTAPWYSGSAQRHCWTHAIQPSFFPVFQAALDGREAALAETEQLRAESAALSRRLVSMKEAEIERMNEINSMHADMVSPACEVMFYSDMFCPRCGRP